MARTVNKTSGRNQVEKDELIAVIAVSLAAFLKTTPEKFRITALAPVSADNARWRLSSRIASLRSKAR